MWAMWEALCVTYRLPLWTLLTCHLLCAWSIVYFANAANIHNCMKLARSCSLFFFKDCLDMWVILGACRSNSWQKTDVIGGGSRREKGQRKSSPVESFWARMCWQRSTQDSSRSLKRQRTSDNVFSINGPRRCFFLWRCKTLNLSKLAEPCELCEQSNNYVIKVICQLNYIETVS